MNASSINIRASEPILIVEDSPTQAERLKYILEKNHYPYVCAHDGREAIAVMADRLPSLVISDIVMPEMDGYHLCRHLKQDPRSQDVPVILLTSLSDPIDVVKGLECGADNFIFKPYEEDYLLSRISYILANRHLRETENTRMGVEIYFAGRRFFITSDRLQILNLLLSTYETAVERNRELAHARDDLRLLNEHLEARVQERTAALRAEMAERQQAEAHVREQAELLNKARDAIVATDLEHRVTYWNASAERLYGWSAAEVLGRRVEDLGLGLTTERFNTAYAALLARGEWRGDYTLRTKSGELRHIEATWSLVFDAENRPRSVLSIDTDVTEKKKLEAEILRAQRIESIGMLASGVAHDLNNALSPILMAAELLAADCKDPQDARLLDMISAGAHRSADMVKQILTFARGSSDGQRSPVGVARLLREAGDLCRQTFPRNIEVRVAAAADLWPVAGDVTQLHQVLLNLCVNARDAMPDGGVLSLAAENRPPASGDGVPAGDALAGPSLLLTVSDTGTGMAPDVLARIFEPFFTTKAADKGTGLGLSTVRTIVNNHGGFLRVDSAPGKGTVFSIGLPAEPVAPAVAASVATPVAPPTGNGELVLVVDDEAAIRGITAQALETFGYRVLTAADGMQAVALCQQHRDELRLMVADLAMPVMDGVATVRAVHAVAPDVRIILASGAGASERADPAEGLTVHGRMTKPYRSDHLLALVHRVLTGKTGG